MTEELLTGEARMEEEALPGYETELNALKAKYNGGKDERMAKCRRARKAPPIDERGDWYYGKFTLPHVRQRQKEDFEARVGGIYSKRGNDWAGAVVELVPTGKGQIRRAKLLKVTNPGTDEARALLAWLHIEDMTFSEVASMSQEPWPVPEHVCTVVQQPRVGAA